MNFLYINAKNFLYQYPNLAANNKSFSGISFQRKYQNQ